MTLLPYLPCLDQIDRVAPDFDDVTSLINSYRNTPFYREITKALQYYVNDKDIRHKKRLYTNNDGEQINLGMLANSRINFASFRNVVDQKSSFLLAKKFTFETSNGQLSKILKDNITPDTRTQILNLGNYAIACGLAWSIFYYTDDGRPAMKVAPANEVLPIWEDAEHNDLKGAIHFYTRIEYGAYNMTESVQYVDVYSRTHIYRYRKTREGQHTLTTTPTFVDSSGNALPFNMVPFIPWKYNYDEVSLLKITKELLDEYDKIVSGNVDSIHDIPQSIKIVRGYMGTEEGTDRGDFIKSLSELRAVFVDKDGDVTQLTDKLNVEAAVALLDILYKAIYSTSNCVDIHDSELGALSGVALKLKYQPMTIDALKMGNYFEKSIRTLVSFILKGLEFTGQGIKDPDYRVIFDLDMPINEKDIIESIKASVGMLSRRTLLAMHPYVDDVDEELKRIKAEEAEKQESLVPAEVPAGGDDGDAPRE